MNLIKFDPRPFRTNQFTPGVFDDFFGKSSTDFMGSDFATNVPSVNVKETADGFHLEVAAPGLKKDDFRISVEKNRMTISSEKRTEEEVREAKFMRREFNYSTFSRSFILPNIVDKDKISAKYEHGVLYVTIPKKPEIVKEEQGRTIDIV